MKRTKNVGDADLSAAIDAWRTANKEEIDTFFCKARQITTHRGGIQTEAFQHWEIDHANDTQHPTCERMSRLTHCVENVKNGYFRNHERYSC